MRILIIAAALICITGNAPAQPSAASDCAVRASSAWTPRNSAPITIEAFADGPDCARASATLVLRNGAGAILWVEAFSAEHLFTLQDARTRADMREALSAWIQQTAATFPSTADLPAWEEGAEAPAAGEFPFYVESWMERDYYETLRARAAPVYCYVQGMESIACLMFNGEGFEKIGVQSFPG